MSSMQNTSAWASCSCRSSDLCNDESPDVRELGCVSRFSESWLPLLDQTCVPSCHFVISIPGRPDKCLLPYHTSIGLYRQSGQIDEIEP